MKKMTLILIQLSFLIVFLNAKSTKAGLEWYWLKGNVKSFEEISGDQSYKRTITFDVKGNETSYVSQMYDQDKKAFITDFTRTSNYDINYNLIQKVETASKESNTITCKYNDKMQLIEEKDSSDGKLTKYSYDDKGNQIEQLIFDPVEKVTYKTTYKYNTIGKLIESEPFNGSGEPEWKNYYMYDDKGREIEFDRTVKQTDIDEESGEEVEYELNTVLRRSEYNEQGFLSKETTESTDTYIDSENVTFTYTYDKMGNWIKMNIFVEGKKPDSKTRVIVYY